MVTIFSRIDYNFDRILSTFLVDIEENNKLFDCSKLNRLRLKVVIEINFDIFQ